MPFPCFEFHGNRLWWTRERVVAALAQALEEISGPLPCVDADWSRIKRGRLDWPPATKVLDYFGAMARGWLAAGAGRDRIRFRNLAWIPAEDEYLLEHAGAMTLKEIVGDQYSIFLKDPPCLRGIDTRIRDGKLHFVVWFRSWDLWAGFPANLAGIQTLKEYMACQIGVEDGEIIACSKGMHLYDYTWELARQVVRM